jgi:hypothetical protein
MKKERFSTLMVFARETTGTKIPSIMVLVLQAHSDMIPDCLVPLLGGHEKADVGGSIMSLATTLSSTYKSVSPRFHSNWHGGIRLVWKRGLSLFSSG